MNLFADMGVQPTSLDSALVAASKSTDTTAPTAAISTPAAGSSQSNGSKVTVTGTAADVGGRVAGVEVSVDGGDTWHAADGTTSWTYQYIQREVGPATIRARAMDDSANIGAPVEPQRVRGLPVQPLRRRRAEEPIGRATTPPPSWACGSSPPATASSPASGSTRARGTPARTSGPSGPRAGEKLDSVTFAGETTTGWQTASFASPVAVAAGQTYVVSYRVPNGRYAADAYAFSSAPHNTGPLLVDGGFGATPAGVYGPAGTFPSQSYQNTNYFVDVLFSTQDASPLIATSQTPAPDSSSVSTKTKVSARFSKPMAAGTPGLVLKDSTGATVPGATSYDAATRTITFTPTQFLAGFVTYTATLSGTDTSGNQITAGKTWSFTTGRASVTARSLPLHAVRRGPPPHRAGGERRYADHAGRALHLDQERPHRGHQVLQGAGQHRQPHRHAVVRGRHRARHGNVHQRVEQRLADPHLQPGRVHHQGHHVRRVVPVQRGVLDDTQRVLGRGPVA